MKKVFLSLFTLIIAAFMLFSTSAFCEIDKEDVEEKEVKIEYGYCPITLISGEVKDCLICHLEKTFKIREVAMFEEFEMPNTRSNLGMENDEIIGKFDASGGINGYMANSFNEFITYLNLNHPAVSRVIIEIHSPGGSLFDGYKIVGIIKHWRAKGYTIETRVHGFAASAGFFIFCAGNPRTISPQAELMWHELITFSMFDISGPSDKEDQAAVLRHLQDTANSMIGEISDMTKKELDQKIRKKELWVNGIEALGFGFATGLLE